MEQPKHKSFTYRTSVEWSEDRQGMLRSEGKPSLEISSPPEFKGLPGYWTPEEMLVAAAEICTMSTFLSFGERKNLPLVSYRSSAEGLLEFTEGNYRFTTITIRPEITVGSAWSAEQVEALLHKAHEHCLIANSLTASVVIEPSVIIV
ncbi:MAG: OsmC family protein [Acidobacteriota bacterium]